MYRAFLGLGSNLGDRAQHLRDALEEIGRSATLKAVSTVFETEPYKMKSEHAFLNVAVEVDTPLEPPGLLRKLQEVERTLGRAPRTHMKDREIDIDILLYENFYYEEHAGHTIEVPHPDLANRRFALACLNEIAPGLAHPVGGESIASLLERCSDKGTIERTSIQLHTHTK